MAAAARQAPAATPAPSVASMSRREFLYYIWAASMALFLAETGGGLLWFGIPRFREGEFGGVFELDVTVVPPPDSGPVSFDAGRFWLVNIGPGDLDQHNTANEGKLASDYPQTQGLKALYKICVHLGCLYKWVPTTHRFECPCHGSKYLPTGTRVDGPARRNLDVFIITALDANGNEILSTTATAGNVQGAAIDITGAATLRINTGRRINGEVNSAQGGGK